MRQLPHCFRCHKGVAPIKMKKNMTIIRNHPDFICFNVEIIKDLNLSMTAVGLAAYIQYQYESFRRHMDADLFFARIELQLGVLEKRAYQELCDAGVINDFFKEGIEI